MRELACTWVCRLFMLVVCLMEGCCVPEQVKQCRDGSSNCSVCMHNNSCSVGIMHPANL